jgi:hypothetical protein
MLHGGLQWGIDDDRYGYFFSHRRFNAPNFLSTSPEVACGQTDSFTVPFCAKYFPLIDESPQKFKATRQKSDNHLLSLFSLIAVARPLCNQSIEVGTFPAFDTFNKKRCKVILFSV